MELDVSFKLWIERSCWCRSEEAALRLALDLDVLALDLLHLVFLLKRSLAWIAARSWDACVRGLLCMEWGKLPLRGAEGADVRLPTLGIKRLTLSWVILRSRIWIAHEEEILSSGNETGSVRSTAYWGLEGVGILFVWTWANLVVLIVNEVICFDLCISRAEELEVVLLLLLPEVTLLKYILMGSRLNPALHVFLLHYVLLFLACILALSLGGQFLDQLLVIVGTSVLLFEYRLLLQDALHHFHTNWLLLLIILAWSRILHYSLWESR